MEDQLISFETAKLAKSKGFEIATSKYWCNYYTGEPIFKWKLLPYSELSVNWMEFPAPSQTLLTRWLLENHNIKVTVDSGTLNMAKKWVDWYGHVNTSIIIDHRDGYPTKEQALEVLLKEALKLIK